MKTNLAEGKRPASLKNIAPSATIDMSSKQDSNRCPRAFKTAWFAKVAQKADIPDKMLCKAMKQVLLGQADDLGGGVFKKRLNDNLHRSIILADGGEYWIYQYLFAKKDRDNIENDELEAFRFLAKDFRQKTLAEIEKLIENKQLLEICNDDKTEIQK